MEKYTRKSVFSELKDFCIMAKEHDYIEVTEWKNLEGFDIDLNGTDHIGLTWGQFKAIKKCVKELNK